MIITAAVLRTLAPWTPDEYRPLIKGRPRIGPPPTPNREEFPFTGSLIFQGIPIYIENRKGTVRRGIGPNGPWSTQMLAHYGEFAETVGMDGDAVDVYVGGDAGAPTAYVVHQKIPGTAVMDEDKVILGCRTAGQARKLYMKHYDRPGFFGGMTPWPVAELREYLGSRAHRGKRLDAPKRVRSMTKGGPFLGPRGGKWADPAHTIPFKEPSARTGGGSWPPMTPARRQAIARFDAMTDEELYGVDTAELDRAAFGIDSERTIHIPIALLRPIADDHANAKYAVGRKPSGWKKHLAEPIEVKLKGGVYHIEDGHHRYETARRMKKPTLPAVISPDDNPITAIRRLGKSLKSLEKGLSLKGNSKLVLRASKKNPRARRWQRITDPGKIKKIAESIELLEDLDTKGAAQFFDLAEKHNMRSLNLHLYDHGSQGHVSVAMKQHALSGMLVSVSVVDKTVTLNTGLWRADDESCAILKRLAALPRFGQRIKDYTVTTATDVADKHPGSPEHDFREAVTHGTLAEVAAKIKTVKVKTPERQSDGSYRQVTHQFNVIDEPKDLTWYHATQASNVPAIEKKGLLKSGSFEQGTGWTHMNANLQSAVYLTADKEYATKIAETLARKFGKPATILKIEGAAVADYSRIVIDEDELQLDEGGTVPNTTEALGSDRAHFHMSIQTLHSIGYTRHIKPEHIGTHATILPTSDDLKRMKAIKARDAEEAREEAMEKGAGARLVIRMAKNGPHPGQALLPSKKNPGVKRWQKTGPDEHQVTEQHQEIDPIARAKARRGKLGQQFRIVERAFQVGASNDLPMDGDERFPTPIREKAPESLRQIVDSVTLWTGGKVAVVRDPSKWKTSMHGIPLAVEYVVPPSRENYQKAHDIMKDLAFSETDGPHDVLRGMVLPKSLIGGLKKGSTFDLGAISSWTKDLETAEEFAQLDLSEHNEAVHGSVLFKATSNRGTDISGVSSVPSEEEVVIGGRVVIVSVEDGVSDDFETPYKTFTVKILPEMSKGGPVSDELQKSISGEFDREHPGRRTALALRKASQMAMFGAAPKGSKGRLVLKVSKKNPAVKRWQEASPKPKPAPAKKPAPAPAPAKTRAKKPRRQSKKARQAGLLATAERAEKYLLGYGGHEQTQHDQRGDLQLIRKACDPEVRELMDAVALWTAGSVATVRDPSKHSAGLATKGVSLSKFYTAPTDRESYAAAHDVMKLLASSKGPRKLKMSRGMHLPAAVLSKLHKQGKGAIFDIGAVSSWTYQFKTAEHFAQKAKHVKGAAAVVFTLETNKGGDVSVLSKFPEETEHVLGGRLQVVSSELVGSRPDMYLVSCKLLPSLAKAGPVGADIQAAISAQLDQPLHRDTQTLKKAVLVSLLKATIATPKKADGSVNYDSVPVGGTIWVTVTDQSSPLHGRPIMITKRPDHQFALTGGSGAKHIKARKHLTMQGGKIRQSQADKHLAKKKKEVEDRNAPKKTLLKQHRAHARKLTKKAEGSFMAAVGIVKRGVSAEEKAKIQATALQHAENMGMEGKEARQYAKLLASGIAKKDRQHRVKQAAHRLEIAKWIHQGEDPDQAEDMAGPAPGALQVTPPDIAPEKWAEMSAPEREHAIAEHLDSEVHDQEREQAEGWRFEDDGKDGDGAISPETDPDAGLDETPSEASGPGGTLSDAGDESVPADAVELGDDGTAAVEAPEEEEVPPKVEPITIGHEDEEDDGPQTKPILSEDDAGKAIEAFKEYAAAQKSARDVAATIEDMPEGEPAAPASVDELKLKARAVSDEELDHFLAEYGRKASEPADSAFYSALSPHWNENIGNKLNGAVTTGAAAAITGIVGAELGARYDVQRLVDALGPETASIAVAQRMREEMKPAEFKAFVKKVRDHNAENQTATERTALQRHTELQRQSEDLEKQISGGDLQSQSTIAMLRSRNLIEQRENLGGALGSLQASAALYDAAERASVQDWKKAKPVSINVGSKAALEDKLKRLGKFKHKVHFDVHTGQYQIKTTTQALRKYVARTQANREADAEMHSVKMDASGITPDSEGREWVHGYKADRFRSHFPDAAGLPAEMKHLAGKPISMMADQRNNIEWVHKSGGGLVNLRTGGGKTVVSIGVAGKMLAKNPNGRHLRVVPDGREEQWAAEISNFSDIHVTILPAKSKKEDRHRILRNAPPGSIVVVGHKNAGRYDHQALTDTHEWDSVGIDEPQELRSKSGSGKMSAGAKRIFKIPAKNRHALTATPATDNPVEAYDIVNWARPGVLGFRSRFKRSFDGFGGGTNAQDAALQKSLYSELEPHISAHRAVPTHYDITHHDRPVSTSASQLRAQKEIESRVDSTVETAVRAAYDKKKAGTRGYAEKSHAALRKAATDKAMTKLEGEHRANLGGGDKAHNPKLAELHKTISGSSASERHVVFVDSPHQRRAVTAMAKEMGRESYNIATSAKGAVNKGPDGQPIAAIEQRKAKWKQGKGGVMIIDRSSASGHNLAEGHHLHVLGDPDAADQMLQAHGRLGRSNRKGDFSIHTYRYQDSPFAHHTWNKLNRQVKVLKATAPGLFVKGRKESMAKAVIRGFTKLFKAAHPSGAGWQTIPGGRRGGFRRQKSGGNGYEYWYQSDARAKQAVEHHTEQAESAGRLRDKMLNKPKGGNSDLWKKVAASKQKQADAHIEHAAGASDFQHKDSATRGAGQSHAGKRTLGVDEGLVWSATADMLDAIITTTREGAVNEVKFDKAPRRNIKLRLVNGRIANVRLKIKQATNSGFSGTLASHHIRDTIDRDGRLTDDSRSSPLEIVINVPQPGGMGQFADKKKFYEQFRHVLAHELAHGIDDLNRAHSSRDQEKYKKHGADYYNDAAEVVAYRHNIFRELNDPAVHAAVKEHQSEWGHSEDDAKELRAWFRSQGELAVGVKSGPASVGSDVVAEMLNEHSPTWNRVKGGLTSANRRKMLNTAATVLAAHGNNTSTPMKKAVKLVRFLMRKAPKRFREDDLKRVGKKVVDRSNSDRSTGRSRALLTHAALVDSHAQEAGKDLEALHRRITRLGEQAGSPLDRAEARRAAYHLNEVGGALRYSGVTGTDSSDLPV